MPAAKASSDAVGTISSIPVNDVPAPASALLVLAALVLLGITGGRAAQAVLVNRGGGMIYDTTRNITWLADMNYASTNGHSGTGVHVDGSMT